MRLGGGGAGGGGHFLPLPSSWMKEKPKTDSQVVSVIHFHFLLSDRERREHYLVTQTFWESG